jgi:hypothetical protein
VDMLLPTLSARLRSFSSYFSHSSCRARTSEVQWVGAGLKARTGRGRVAQNGKARIGHSGYCLPHINHRGWLGCLDGMVMRPMEHALILIFQLLRARLDRTLLSIAQLAPSLQPHIPQMPSRLEKAWELDAAAMPLVRRVYGV